MTRSALLTLIAICSLSCGRSSDPVDGLQLPHQLALGTELGGSVFEQSLEFERKTVYPTDDTIREFSADSIAYMGLRGRLSADIYEGRLVKVAYLPTSAPDEHSEEPLKDSLLVRLSSPDSVYDLQGNAVFEWRSAQRLLTLHNSADRERLEISTSDFEATLRRLDEVTTQDIRHVGGLVLSLKQDDFFKLDLAREAADDSFETNYGLLYQTIFGEEATSREEQRFGSSTQLSFDASVPEATSQAGATLSYLRLLIRNAETALDPLRKDFGRAVITSSRTDTTYTWRGPDVSVIVTSNGDVARLEINQRY